MYYASSYQMYCDRLGKMCATFYRVWNSYLLKDKDGELHTTHGAANFSECRLFSKKKYFI
jgi:hypothetical protein